MAGRGHDWDALDAKIEALVLGDPNQNIIQLARAVGVPHPTLRGRLSKLGIHAGNLSEFPERLEEARLDELGVGLDQIEKLAVNEGANDKLISYTTDEPTTVEELLERCKVDLSVWQVDKPEIRSWPVAAKNIQKDVKYKEGKKSGREFQQGLVAHRLYYFKIPLRRIKPVAVMPAIQPIEVVAEIPKPTKPSKNGLKKALGFFDLQFGFRRNLHTSQLEPFHDRRVLDLGLQLIEQADEPYDEIIFGGDEMDLSEWSTRWPAEPEFFWTTQATIIELHWWLQQIRKAAPNAKIVMLEGNHDRFKDAVIAHLRAAYELRPADELHRDAVLSMPRLLALDSLHIEFIDGYKRGAARYQSSPYLAWTHGDVARRGYGASAGGMVDKNYTHIVHGHDHRIEVATKTILFNDERYEVQAISVGCGCHVDGRVPGSKAEHNWQQGLVEASFSQDAHPAVMPIHILNGRMTHNHRIFKARNRDDEAEAVIREGMSKIAG